MPWLSNTECLQYAPGISISGEALTTAITLAQILVEGVNGANRQLEVNSYTRILVIPNSGRLLFPLTPVLASPAPQIYLRGSDLPPRFGLYSTQEWQLLEINKDYTIDFSTNEIVLLTLAYSLRHEYSVTGFRRYQRTPTSAISRRQLKVVFSSGFNFTATPNTNEVLDLKRALASIVALRTSAQAQGVKKLEVSDDKYVVEYAGKNDYLGISGNKFNGSPLNELLSIFRKYRPSEFSV
ncbi:hypothetical protein CrV_gp022 [Cylindrospermopsis raciborskii virus RM-2018a]|jgi:hypothetical protein|nr:hypothetical protein CrV_gp022 [Cylindrospermopsis raciborskii virus RM-2018a]WHL30588.1 hypothetical protein CrLKS4_g22 [Cylindrospermopsis phage Cr-LKS4]